MIAEPVPISPTALVTLPRYGNSTAEDALTRAWEHGHALALERLEGAAPGLRFDLKATTTDDNRFALCEAPGEPPAVDNLRQDLVRVFGCPVDKRPVTVDRDHRWRAHDRLIHQTEAAASAWRAFAPTELSAHPATTDQSAVGPLVWEGTLEPGASMYVPRGWAVEPIEQIDTTQAPVELTIERFTGIDLVHELMAIGIRSPLLRADAPADIAAQTDAYAEHLYIDGAFAEHLGDLATLEHLDVALNRLQAGVTAGPVDPMDRSVLLDNPIELVAPTGVRLIVNTAGLLAAFCGVQVAFEPETLALVAEIASGTPFLAGELPLAGPAGSAQMVLDRLNGAGLLRPADA